MFMLKNAVATFVLLIVVSAPDSLRAQFAGSRGGNMSSPSSMDLPARTFDRSVEEYIVVDGKVEVRVLPNQIRIVLAVVQSAESASECQKLVFDKIAEFRAQLETQGIESADVVDDFIAVIPQYDFKLVDEAGTRVARELKAGYVMQSNLHVRVSDDDQAMKVIRLAFQNDIPDIIAFDYWSDELDAARQTALEKAMQEAQRKAKLLVHANFDEPVRLINIDSTTHVVLPHQLYDQAENTASENFRQVPFDRRSIPMVLLPKPKNTYYRGFFDPDIDRQSAELPMQNKISVVGMVRLYFESPAARDDDDDDDRDDD